MPVHLNEIHLVPVNGKVLLHAPLHGVSALINTKAGVSLQNALDTGRKDDLPAVLNDLWERLDQPPSPIPGPYSGSFAPRQLGLLPTNDCNLRCVYCAVSAGHSDRTFMSTEICDAALDYQADTVRRNGFKSLAVALFGGEPFFHRPVVEQCAQKGRKIADELGVSFLFTGDTNAFMGPAYAKWIARNLTYLLISLDGPARIQNRYRPAIGGGKTYDTVARNVEIFQDNGLPFALRSSVSAEVARHLPEIAEHFCEKFSPEKINFEPLVITGRCVDNRLKSPHPSDFVNGVVQAGKVARAHGVGIKLSTAQPESIECSNCPVARDHFVVAPDGLVAGCYAANHKGSEHSEEYAIGRFDPVQGSIIIDRQQAERLRSYGVENIPRCADCFCKWHCAGGCRLHHTPAFSTAPPNAYCLITQRLTVWRLLSNMGLYGEADRITLEKDEVDGLCHA